MAQVFNQYFNWHSMKCISQMTARQDITENRHQYDSVLICNFANEISCQFIILYRPFMLAYFISTRRRSSSNIKTAQSGGT